MFWWTILSLVVKGEESRPRGRQFESQNIFNSTFDWIRAWIKKICWKLYSSIVPCAVILQIRGWILRKGWHIKPSSMVYNEIIVYQLNEANVLQKQSQLIYCWWICLKGNNVMKEWVFGICADCIINFFVKQWM